MDKIFHSTFDFFTHALPGFCIFSTIITFDSEYYLLDGFINTANSIKIGGGILILIISYIIGFVIYPFGRFLYKRLGPKVCKDQIHNDIDLFISDKFVLVRELSPNNFKYIETWNMFCAMAHNLAVSSLVLFIVSIVKIIIFKSVINIWGILIPFSFLLFVIFLHRAYKFHIWAADDLNASITCFNLDKKAKVKTLDNPF